MRPANDNPCLACGKVGLGKGKGLYVSNSLSWAQGLSGFIRLS